MEYIDKLIEEGNVKELQNEKRIINDILSGYHNSICDGCGYNEKCMENIIYLESKLEIIKKAISDILTKK